MCGGIIPILRKTGATSNQLSVRRRKLSAPRESARRCPAWIYHLHSIWLFTFSDLKTIVIPSTVFAAIHSISHVLQRGSQDQLAWALTRSMPVALWAWLNLLPFAIDNQRQPEAIEEDRINKPWRTMPAKRMTQDQARRVMFVLYPAAVLTSAYLGGLRQSLVLVILGVWYNDLAGADASCVIRNFINGCGFVCYTSGAMQVALQIEPFSDRFLSLWFTTIGAVIFSTVQTQDMYDQSGDSVRGRKTVPLVIGDQTARWTIALPTGFWSIFCPWFWTSPLAGYVAPVSLGLFVVIRTLRRRSAEHDKDTFRLWNLWLISLYCLPLVKAIVH